MLPSYVLLELSGELSECCDKCVQSANVLFQRKAGISRFLAVQRVSVVSLLSHKAHQERAYQEYLASMAMEKAQQQEGYYEQMTAVNQSELTCIPTACHILYASY